MKTLKLYLLGLVSMGLHRLHPTDHKQGGEREKVAAAWWLPAAVGQWWCSRVAAAVVVERERGVRLREGKRCEIDRGG